MIEYLRKLLAGHDDGIVIDIWYLDDRHPDQATLLAADDVGVVLQGKDTVNFRPWPRIQLIRVKR